MKKIFTSLCALLMAGTMAVSAQGHTLRTLTFEDADLGASFSAGKTGDGAFDATAWSDLIDNPQYGGFLYSGSTIWWHDGGNTELYQTFALPYWSGGHAISNYACNDLTTYGDYTMQLTVYKSDAATLVQTGGGHNGSNNFAIHFGYNAASYSYGTDSRQDIVFADGVERVIDHMYVNNTTYFLNQFLTGGGFNPAATAESWARIIATGYNASNEETNTIYFYLCQGNELESNGVITEWTKWDMTELGAVASVKFDMDASADMIGIYGLNCPAYFAYDDVAVRFQSAEPEPTSYTRSGLTLGKYGTICLAYNVNEGDYSGATFYKVVARNDEYVTLEDVTSLNAGEAYIFKATATEINCTYSGDKVTAPLAASVNNVLQGVFEDGTVPAGKWFLNNNQLWCSTGTQTVGANRAYLTDLTPAATNQAPGRHRLNMPIQANTPTVIENTVATEATAQKVMLNGNLYILREGTLYDMRGNCVK